MIYLTSLALILYISGVFIAKEITEIGQLLLIAPVLFSIYFNFKNKKLKLPNSSYWLISFIIISFLSIWINSELIERASWHYYFLRAPLLGVLGIYLFRYWNQASTDLNKKWTINFILLGILISCGWGLYLYLKDNISIFLNILGEQPAELPRLYSFIDTMKLGYGLAFILSLLLPAIIHREKLNKVLPPKFLIFTAVIVAITLILTFTRGAVLGLMCSLPLTLYFYKKKWGYYFAAIALCCISFVGSYYFFGSQNASIRFVTTKNNHSDNLRRSVWLSGVYAIKERPLTGWGYFNLKPNMHKIKTKYDIPQKHYNSHSHNNFLEVGAGTGLIGLFIFIGWIVAWIRESLTLNFLYKVHILSFIIVFLVLGQFEVTLDHRLVVILFIVYSFGSQSIDLFSKKEIKVN